ncbi:MAG TPA: hypothetical protein VIY48_02600 [Candidatus Paceibacterota bacterium]
MIDELVSVRDALTREIDGAIGYIEALRAEAEQEIDRFKRENELLRASVAEERKLRETAERNGERFRYALFVYLQERNGPAGIHAPTPETLALIRDLVGEQRA